MARGTPLLSAAASRSGRDIVTFHRRGPMSRQPAQDSQTERGLPTHVPPVQGVNRLWSHSALKNPRRHGNSGQGGGLVYSSGLLPRSLSLYEQGGGGRSADESKHGKQHAPQRSGKSTWYGGARSRDAYLVRGRH